MKKKGIIHVKSVMTPFPYTVELSASLGEAEQMMKEHNIHHLPVSDQGKPLGVISDRDLRWAGGFGALRDTIKSVADIYRKNPCVVDLEEPFDKVLDRLVDERLEEVLVMKNDRLVGIITMVDVCRAAAELARNRYPTEPDPLLA